MMTVYYYLNIFVYLYYLLFIYSIIIYHWSIAQSITLIQIPQFLVVVKSYTKLLCWGKELKPDDAELANPPTKKAKIEPATPGKRIGSWFYLQPRFSQKYSCCFSEMEWWIQIESLTASLEFQLFIYVANLSYSVLQALTYLFSKITILTWSNGNQTRWLWRQNELNNQ